MVQLNKAPGPLASVVAVASWVCRRSEGRADLAELRWRWPKGGNSHQRIPSVFRIKAQQYANKHKNLRNLPKIGNFDALRCRPRVLTIDVRSPAEFEAGHIPGAEHPSVTLRVSAEMFTFMRYVSWAPYLVPRKWVRRNHLGFFQNTPLRRTSLETDMHCGSFSRCLSCLLPSGA